MADLTKVITTSAVALARDQVGYKEGNRNWTKYARDDYPAVQNQAWCGSFVGWICQRAGFDVDPYVWVPFVPYIENWARKNGFWRTDRARAGDIVVYGFGRSSGQHTGIAWPDESTGGDSYRAIEGNTSSGNGGSQTNGDGVYVRYRSRSTIRGWVDMSAAIAHYGTGTKPKLPAESVAGKDFADVDWTQRTLNELGYAAGTVDGVVGTKTTAATRAFQTDYGITADGRPGPDTRKALAETMSMADDIKAIRSRTDRYLDTKTSHVARKVWEHPITLHGGEFEGKASTPGTKMEWSDHERARVRTLAEAAATGSTEALQRVARIEDKLDLLLEASVVRSTEG